MNRIQERGSRVADAGSATAPFACKPSSFYKSASPECDWTWRGFLAVPHTHWVSPGVYDGRGGVTLTCCALKEPRTTGSSPM